MEIACFEMSKVIPTVFFVHSLGNDLIHRNTNKSIDEKPLLRLKSHKSVDSKAGGYDAVSES